MKIKKLEVCGFKSFVDRAVLTFDQDVTCVVGPNGCGKSNIVDAIRWVMGEQSAKNLRGRGMEDVIFNGAESRGPHSFAEVTITFDNSDGLAPPEYRDYTDIAVTRRLDRQGNSEYLINKQGVRLMDVTNLFLGTGVGRKAYSIVEQGRIGLIVSAKAEDRRHLIEEAAGITKFKAKKRAAERKMDQTQQNLLRVSDIIAEIQKTLASLKRQAQKAERYKRYRAEIRDLELWVASHRWLELTAQHRVLRSELHTANASTEGARAALRVREAELEAERVELQGTEAVVEKVQTRAYEADNQVKLLESQVQHYAEKLQSVREREAAARRELSNLSRQRDELGQESRELSSRLHNLADAEQAEAEELARQDAELARRREAASAADSESRAARGRLSEAEARIARADATLAGFDKRREESRQRLLRLEAEREQVSAKVTDLVQEADALRARIEGLKSGQDELGKHRGQLEEELAGYRREIVDSDERVEALRAQLASKRSRLHSLEEIQQRFEGVGAGVRAVMTHFGAQGERDNKRVQGLVADRFECPSELTQALAAALGERLQYVVVDELATGVDAVRYLSEGKRGRATLIPSHPRGERAALPAALDGEGVVGQLMRLVTVRDEDRQLAEHLLGDVLVVEDLDAARTLHERGQGSYLLVTRDGQVLAPDGSLSGGEGEDAGAHLLEVKREVRELHDEVAKLDAEMSAAMAHHGSLRNAIAQRQAALEAARSDVHEQEIGLVKAERDLKGSEQARTQAEQRIATLGEEAQELTRMLDGASADEDQARRERTEAEAGRAQLQADLAAAEEVLEGHRRSVEEQSALVTEVRVRAAQARERLQSDQAVVERLERSVEELDTRSVHLQQELTQCAQQQGELAGRSARDSETLEISVREAMAAADEVSQLRAEYDAARGQLASLEQELREVRARIEADQKRVAELSLEEREVVLALKHLTEAAYEKHRVDIRTELTDHHDRPQPDEATHGRIAELQRLVERMGEINLMAIEEYEERAERYEYLSNQKQDLETALAQLDTAIRQMNRQSRKMFREAYDAINERFKIMFPRMFGGGRAELRLTNPEDLLEAGIDIVAQPPGKKLTSIELMSGGEKALTAVSLIFAIFQYKPSPFCLLDEVDAPLDEANIERYCEMIRSMTDRSQFILITHSKTTMALGDVLYGVTMETPGISKLVSVQMRDYEQPTQDDGESAAVA